LTPAKGNRYCEFLMLRLLRLRSSSLLVASVLCTSVGLSTIGVLGHGAEHDGLPAVVQHDAAAHAFQADPGATVAHPLHCLVCHWARSFRPYPRGASHPAPVVEYSLRIHPDVFLITPAALAALPPLRSPPIAA
jgi:hypothetical protein